MPHPENYRPQLDALRAIAVLAVLHSHFWTDWATGHYGVRLFFVLSGFLITQGLLELRGSGENGRNLVSFYGRRMLRIWPLYYLLLGITTLADCQGMRDFAAWHAVFASNFLFFHVGDWTPNFAAPWWSLAVEEQFYLVWPLIVLWSGKRALRGIVLAVIAIGTLWQVWIYTVDIGFGSSLLTPASFDALGAGALLAMLNRKGAKILGLLPHAGIAALAMCAALWWILGDSWQIEILSVVAMAAAVHAASRGIGGWPSRVLECAPLLWIGKVSFGVYLLHIFLKSAAMRLSVMMGFDEASVVTFVGGTAASVAVASISWLLLERPALSLKHHFRYHRRSSLGRVGAALT